MDIIIVAISWLLLGGATSYFARQRGRDPLVWFFIGMLLGILGLLLLFLLPSVALEEEKSREGDTLEELKEEDSGFRFREWYYLSNAREQVGPNSYSNLRDMWNSKTISEETYVWCDGMEIWKKIEELPKLRESLE